jgi:hypothetical protein
VTAGFLCFLTGPRFPFGSSHAIPTATQCLQKAPSVPTGQVQAYSRLPASTEQPHIVPTRPAHVTCNRIL